MKKFILSLFVGLIGIISFCNAETIVINSSNLPTNLTLEESINNYEYEFNGVSSVYGSSCNVYVKSVNGGSVCEYKIYSDNTTSTTCDTYTPLNSTYPSVNGPFNFQGFGGGCNAYNPDWSLTLTLPGGNSCPEIDTGAILSGYILESDYNNLLNNYNILSGQFLNLQNNYNSCQSDLSSCQSFTSGFNSELNNCSSNLNACNTSLTSCLQNNCPVISGDIQRSSLYINDIQHEGAGIVNVFIPEEFNWDYTNSGGIFDLNVEGYNVDTDYISGIIDTQNSKPSQGDLNKLVSEVLPLFIPGLVVILFLYFIFRFIKKIF